MSIRLSTNAGFHSGSVLTSGSLRANVLEVSDGKIVRFDQYVDSATINPIIGA